MSNILKTNFKKVMEFNRAFDMVPLEPSEYFGFIEDSNGNIQIDPLKYVRKTIFDDSPATIKLRLDLIKEEIEELNDAILQKDIIEQRDACADILYVVYGMADVLGFDIDNIFISKIKCKIGDNMSNKCNNELNNYISKFTDLNNSSNIISNFNYIKTFSTDFLGFEICSKDNRYMSEFVINKLQTIYKELEELCIDNINNINNIDKFKNVSNNLYNLLSWTYIMTLVLGVNADNDFDIVHNSNMSKLCSTEDDAKATVSDYELKYKSGTSPYDSPYYYYLPKLNKWIVKNLSSGKALKNIKYKAVSFTNQRFVF